MPTQLRLPVQPVGAQEINASSVPVFIHRADDAVGRRVAAVQMMELGLARQNELSAALHVNRTTLYRQQRRVKADGVLGVVDSKRGLRGPHRFTPEKRQRVEVLLHEGGSIRQATQFSRRLAARWVAEHLRRGRLVGVEGRLQIRRYETAQGKRRKTTEVVADRVRFLDRKPSEVGAGHEELAGDEALTEGVEAGVPF